MEKIGILTYENEIDFLNSIDIKINKIKVMTHNLSSQEIRKMYNLLYKYEQTLKHIGDKSLISVDGLTAFLQENDIYKNTITKNNQAESINHRGFILYGQAEKNEWVYKLIHHIRNAFAHGFVALNKRTNIVSFKDGERKIIGGLPKDLIVPFMELLYKAHV